jgi:protein-disulfide isomerase
MATTTEDKKVTKSIKPAKSKGAKDSFVIRIPHFKDISLNTYLIFVIVVFAFILGMLTIKVFDLQQEVGASKDPTTAAAAAAQPSTDALPPSGPSGPVNVGVGNFPVRGNANAKVTVIEFADFRCPFCEEWFQTIEPNLIKDYVNTGKVKYDWRNYAFLGPASVLASNAGECANEQNQFWAFHDYMYKHQPDESDTSMYTVDNLSQIAGNLGMDQSQFQSCLTAKKYNNLVTKDMTEGAAAGVSGTPTTFINGIAIVGAVPYAQIKAAIDNDLK